MSGYQLRPCLRACDGRNEILVTWGYTGTGATLESAKLVRFDAHKLVEIRTFPNAYSDNCNGGIEPRIKNFVVIRAVTRRGAAPEFKIDRESAPCK